MATNTLGQYLPAPSDTLDTALAKILKSAGTVTVHTSEAAFKAAASAAVWAGQAQAPVLGLAGGAIYTYDGSETWQLTPRAVQSGTVGGQTVTNGSTATWNLVFPKPFAGVPLVTASFGGNGRLRAPAVHDVTTHGCKITADNASGKTLAGSAYSLQWKAELI